MFGMPNIVNISQRYISKPRAWSIFICWVLRILYSNLDHIKIKFLTLRSRHLKRDFLSSDNWFWYWETMLWYLLILKTEYEDYEDDEEDDGDAHKATQNLSNKNLSQSMRDLHEYASIQ